MAKAVMEIIEIRTDRERILDTVEYLKPLWDEWEPDMTDDDLTKFVEAIARAWEIRAAKRRLA